MTERIELCNTCGYKFGEEVSYQSLKNRNWLATIDADGKVIQECCEMCAQDVESEMQFAEDTGEGNPCDA